jgi:hypothetical protein
MSNITENKQHIDPKLIEKIELMQPTPERDLRSVTQGRRRFLSELEGMPMNGSRSPLAWLSGLINPKSSRRAENPMSTKKQKFAFPTLIAIIIVVVMLFGGASATAYASQSALPGDALYPLKTSLEQTQATLARDAYSQAQIYMQFAQRRLDEISELIQEGRYADVEVASGEFEYHIQQAIVALQTVMEGDAERGAVLSQEISQALLDYALTLKTVLVNIPDPVKPSVEKALLVSESEAGEGLEFIGVVLTVTDSSLEIVDYPYPIIISELTEIEGAINSGDTVKVHLIVTADGTRIAREIELASSLDEDVVGDDGNHEDGSEDDDINGEDHDQDDDGHDQDGEDIDQDDIENDDSNDDDGSTDEDDDSSDDSSNADNDGNEDDDQDKISDDESGDVSGDEHEDGSDDDGDDGSDDEEDESDGEEGGDEDDEEGD